LIFFKNATISPITRCPGQRQICARAISGPIWCRFVAAPEQATLVPCGAAAGGLQRDLYIVAWFGTYQVPQFSSIMLFRKVKSFKEKIEEHCRKPMNIEED
jgi:hypothetical protein